MTTFLPPADACDVLTYKGVRIFIAQNQEQYRLDMRPTFYGYGLDQHGRVLRLGYGGAAGAGRIFVEPGQALQAIKRAVDEYATKYDYPYFPYRGFEVKLVKWPNCSPLGVAKGFGVELTVDAPVRSTDVQVLNLLRDKIDRYVSYGFTAQKEIELPKEEVVSMIGGPSHLMPFGEARKIVDIALDKAERTIVPEFVDVGTSGVSEILAETEHLMKSAGLDPNTDFSKDE